MLNPKIEEYINQLLLLRKNLGYSIYTDKGFYKNFINYINQNFPDNTEITKSCIDGWLLYKKNIKPSTLNGYILCLKRLSAFLKQNGIESYVPSADYFLKEQDYFPKILSKENLNHIFQVIDKYPTYAVIFRLMYCCGLRPGEPLRLKTNDIIFDRNEIYIRQSKNYKDRHIIFSDDLMKLLKSYDSTQDPNRLYFFETRRKKPFCCNRLSTFLRNIIKNEKLDFAKGFRPYDFRHNFATRNIMNWLDQGLDVMTMLPYLSTYMGHKKFTYTFYYIHLLPERLFTSKNIDWNKLASVYEGGTYEKN